MSQVISSSSRLPRPLQMIWYTIFSALLLALVLQWFSSVSIDSWAWALAAVICIQIIQWFMQPLFSWIAHKLGLLGILLISLFGYAIVMWLTFKLLPGVEEAGFVDTLVAAWIYAIIVTLLQWIILAQSDDYFLRQAIRSARKKPKNETSTPGFLFVQLDGVSSEVLEWQLKAGNLPNIKRLVGAGEYELRRWHTQIPSTTPASQAGILIGSNDNIPAFRWYERESDELVVANQPAGAHLIESRLSTGKGLLADGGVSIGNLFSGDAPTNIMVISKLQGDRESLKTMREYSDYFSNLYGFMRAFVLSVGEIFKEIYQAQRQKIKDIQPRVRRHGSYIFLRAGTNVLLRDLQTTIVLDQMMRGVNSIYVDYLDYDEIAHHAGIARPESLAALSGLDNVVGILTKVTAYTPRPYHVVFVSDHGQSQGPTFKQLHEGKSLEEHVAELLGTTNVLASTAPIENQSTARSLLAEGASGSGVSGYSFKSLRKKFEKRKSVSRETATASEIVVTGSGNLGNVWIKHYANRPTREQLEVDYPELIPKLLSIKGIGLVMLISKDSGPVCIGKDGEINLLTGKVTGINPLAPYPNISTADLSKVANMKNAPDLQIISSMDSSTGEVYAFEELVGNHGGIGGWQTDAILLHPQKLAISAQHLRDGQIVDSTTIHNIFVEWMESAGHRKDMHKRRKSR